jgi:hypothetical protein
VALMTSGSQANEVTRDSNHGYQSRRGIVCLRQVGVWVLPAPRFGLPDGGLEMEAHSRARELPLLLLLLLLLLCMLPRAAP